ncbi:hypothetical protein Tco_0300881 [Tanacetum coccineum]
MSSLAAFAILNGADNRPPMLDKLMYDSWKSRMELYMENRENGYLILESIRNGPLVWHLIEENGEMRRKRVLELSAPEKLQYEADVKAINIILQDEVATDLHVTNFDKLFAHLEHHEAHANEIRLLKEQSHDPLALYSVSHPSTPQVVTYQSNAPQTIYQQPQAISQIDYQLQHTEFPALDFGLIVPVFNKGDDPIEAINKMMSFLSTVVTIQDGRVTVQQLQGRQKSFGAGSSGTKSVKGWSSALTVKEMAAWQSSAQNQKGREILRGFGISKWSHST